MTSHKVRQTDYNILGIKRITRPSKDSKEITQTLDYIKTSAQSLDTTKELNAYIMELRQKAQNMLL
jgi:hypothetical protein